MQITSSFFGGWWGPKWQTHWCGLKNSWLARLRLQFWGKLELQLDCILSTGLGTRSKWQPLWACGFVCVRFFVFVVVFNTVKSVLQFPWKFLPPYLNPWHPERGLGLPLFLTSDFSVGFFFPACLLARAEDPKGKAFPWWGPEPPPQATRTALSHQDPIRDWPQEDDQFNLHCLPARDLPTFVPYFPYYRSLKYFQPFGDTSPLSSQCWPPWNTFLSCLTPPHFSAFVSCQRQVVEAGPSGTPGARRSCSPWAPRPLLASTVPVLPLV